MKKDYLMSREQQVCHLIKDLIIERKLEQGDQLPSIRELSSALSVSKDMINRALEMLSYDGLIIIRPRFGTFVANNSLLSFKQLNWNDLTNSSVYKPSGQKFREMFDFIDDDGKTPHLSMLSVSDCIYLDLLKQANKKVLKALKTSSALEMYHSSGLFELREMIATHMSRYGMDVDPRQIVVCSHMPDALSMVANVVVGHRATVLHETPGMLNHHTYIRSLGADLHGIEMDSYGIKEEAFIKAVMSKKNVILATTPLYSFPTGATTSLSRKKSILNICQNANVPIIEIDDFRDFDLNAPPPYYSLSQGNGTIYIGSFSRTLPFGFALSWVVLPLSLTRTLIDIKRQYDWGPDVYTQMLICSMLKDGSYYEYLSTLQQHLHKRELYTRKILDLHLGDLCTIHGLHPMAYWVELPITNEQILANKELKVVLGSMYASEKNKHVVISKTFPSMDKYEIGIKKLRQVILNAMHNGSATV